MSVLKHVKVYNYIYNKYAISVIITAGPFFISESTKPAVCLSVDDKNQADQLFIL